MEKTFLYFAYGSSLKTDLMAFRANEVLQASENATLKDFTIHFDHLNADGSARANLIIAPGEIVLGVLYPITELHHEHLAETEPGYNLVEIEVETNSGKHKALTFTCNNSHQGISCSESYIRTIVEGAREHGFPEEYIEGLLNKAGKLG